jgi:hypothetical protein
MLSLSTGVAATSSVNQYPGLSVWQSRIWNGSVSTPDNLEFVVTGANGTNPSVNYVWVHPVGTTGTTTWGVESPINFGLFTTTGSAEIFALANPSSGSTGTITIPNPVNGTMALQGTLTLKKGSGGGNYTNATTSYAVADSTNLCYTVTIPLGWKLAISASGALGTSTAIVNANAALTDNAACSTANAGILQETQIDAGTIGGTAGFSLSWVITGDGLAHNIALQFKTSNVADTANLLNSSATLTPTMVFQLGSSN